MYAANDETARVFNKNRRSSRTTRSAQCGARHIPLEDKLARRRSVSTPGTRGGSITGPELMSAACRIGVGESISRRLKLACVEKVRANFSQRRRSAPRRLPPLSNNDLRKRRRARIVSFVLGESKSQTASLRVVSVTNRASWEISRKGRRQTSSTSLWLNAPPLLLSLPLPPDGGRVKSHCVLKYTF